MEDFEATKARRNGGKITHEPYSEERLETIKRLIANFEQKGRKKRYSISVDGELIVPTTYEQDSFDEYLDYVEPHTEIVEVRTYFGDGPNCNRYIFHLKQVPVLNGPGMPTLDAQSQIEQALEKQQLQTKIMLLEAELKRKKKKLKVLKEGYQEEKPFDMKDFLVKGMELYGQFKGGAPIPQLPLQGPPAEVEIEQELSEADAHYAKLKEQFGEKHLVKALQLWEVFMLHPDLQSEFTQIISTKYRQNG